jgi:hypothetical protein
MGATGMPQTGGRHRVPCVGCDRAEGAREVRRKLDGSRTYRCYSADCRHEWTVAACTVCGAEGIERLDPSGTCRIILHAGFDYCVTPVTPPVMTRQGLRVCPECGGANIPCDFCGGRGAYSPAGQHGRQRIENLGDVNGSVRHESVDAAGSVSGSTQNAAGVCVA